MTVKQYLRKFTPHFLLDFYHYSLAFVGSVVYGFPSRKLTVIGITGTSGKSTTVDFTTRILAEAGYKVASISSVRFKIGEREWKNELKMTTPGRFKIQKFLRQAASEHCQYAVLEIASEGIKQHRHRFINFDTAVFTNLSPEHIESHGGFENYRNEKLKLFKAAKNVHVINTDDENARYFLDIPAKKIITFGLEKGDVNVNNADFHLNILGNFNHYNALAAIAVAKNYGVSMEICKRALEKATGVPGRMEVVSKNPLVVVDYAHTPVQLEKAYQSLAPKPLVCVLGSCGGGRDKWKRPELGKIAELHCREIIITNEDPYDEDPLEIMEQVAAGIDNQVKPYHIVPDRQEAIKKAISLMSPEDALIITGKGSEVWMCLADGKKIPWSDKDMAQKQLGKPIP